MHDPHELWTYDPETGHVKWKAHRSSRVRAGSRAGCLKSYAPNQRYREIKVNGRKYREHRVIWFMQTGGWPPAGMDIDHINGDTSDNRWSNLRLVTRSQNNMNRRKHPQNTSGVVGVSHCKQTGKWVAYVKANRKRHWLGRHDTLEDAARAVEEARRQHHGEFAAT